MTGRVSPMVIPEMLDDELDEMNAVYAVYIYQC